MMLRTTPKRLIVIQGQLQFQREDNQDTQEQVKGMKLFRLHQMAIFKDAGNNFAISPYIASAPMWEALCEVSSVLVTTRVFFMASAMLEVLYEVSDIVSPIAPSHATETFVPVFHEVAFIDKIAVGRSFCPFTVSPLSKPLPLIRSAVSV